MHQCPQNLVFHPLWPKDTIWQHKYGSVTTPVMAASNYLNKYWLIIKGVQWHSPESNFAQCAHEFNPYHVLEDYTLKTTHHILQGPRNSSVVRSRRPLWPWWRYQTETFSALLALCAGNSPVTGEFPAQRPGTQSFDVFFDLRLNKPLSKQSLGWLFETPSRLLWRHCNALKTIDSHGDLSGTF